VRDGPLEGDDALPDAPAVVEDAPRALDPGVGLQAPGVLVDTEAEVAGDALAPEEPPEGERLRQTVAPMEPVAGRLADELFGPLCPPSHVGPLRRGRTRAGAIPEHGEDPLEGRHPQAQGD
jgi:hypothetical protein